MPTNIQTVTNFVAKDMGEFFEQESPFMYTANRMYQKAATVAGYATGGNFNIKLPGTPAVQRGLATSATAITDLVVNYPIVENDVYSVNRNMNLYEEIFDFVGGKRALTKMDRKAIVDNYSYPAFQAIQADMEQTAAYRMSVGAFLSPIDSIAVLGTINTISQINDLKNLAYKMKFPQNELTLMMNSDTYTSVANSLNNSFVTEVSRPILETGRFASKKLSGFMVYQSVDMPNIESCVSAEREGVTVSSLSEDGLTLTLTGLASSSGVLITAGTRIAIPAVQILQNITQSVLNYNLVVTANADANGDGAGNCAVTLSFPLLASGEHANVSALPANGNEVEIFPGYQPNYAYVKSGLSSVMLPLGDIEGATNSNVKGDNGCPVKVQVQGNVSDFSNVFRISALQATKVIPTYVLAFPSALPS
jgi:hypothetical protein